MPLNDAALNLGANAIKAGITHLSLHTTTQPHQPTYTITTHTTWKANTQ